MKLSIFIITTLASLVTAQSCAGGAGFCDGSSHCQDRSRVVSSNVDPDCVGGGAVNGAAGGGGRRGKAKAGSRGGAGRGRVTGGGGDINNVNGPNGAIDGNEASTGGNIKQGGPCAGGTGFCDGSGHCQDGSEVVSSGVDPECFV